MALSLQSDQQIRLERSFIWIGIPDFNSVAFARSGPVADCQNDSGRIVAHSETIVHSMQSFDG